MTPLVSYAQNFEDVMLWRALSNVQEGSYIDIGAQDPHLDSVSLLFYERGWRGVNVEPTPRYAEMLLDSRPEDVNVRAAVSAKAGNLKFYEFPDTGLSTSDRQIAKEHIKKGFLAKEIVVPSITLDEVFMRRLGNEIHWLKIDVEGSEKSVIKSWIRSPLRPWIVLVESTYPMSQIETHQQWETLILAKGYKFAYFDGLSRFYIANGHEELFKAFSSGPNVFDVMFHGFSLSATTPFCGVLHGQILKLNEEKETERKNSEQRLLSHEQAIAAQVILVHQQATEQAAKLECDHRDRESVLLRQHAETEELLVKREEEAVAALHSLEQKAQQQREELQQSHHERESAIQLRFAEEERSLSQQMHVTQQQLGRLEQERADRERQHSGQLVKAQQELRSLLHSIATREQEIVAQMILVHQQATESATTLERDHRERESVLLRQNAETRQLLARREQETVEALLSMEQKTQQQREELQQTYREREKQHLDQIEQTQQELHSLLRAMATREREIAAQIALIHQQAIERVATLERDHRDRESVLLQQQAEQHRLSAKQLYDLEYELKRLNDMHETEIQAERQLRLRLRHALVEVHQNVARVRDSLTWRMMAPLRAVVSMFKDEKENRQSLADIQVKSARALDQAFADISDVSQSFTHTTINLESGNFELGALENIMSSSALQPHSNSVSVGQILNLYGDAFVERAYELLLGRSPDTDGMRNYLQCLRAGDSREKILAQIAESPEGQEYGAELKGLRELIASQRASSRKMFRNFFRGSQIERQVYRVENELGRVAQALVVSGAATNIRVSHVENSLSKIHQMMETALSRLTDGVENVRLETNARFVSIEQPILAIHKMAQIELSRIGNDVTQLAAEISVINARLTKAEPIAAEAELAPQTIMVKAYEEAIKPISTVFKPVKTPKFSIIILQFFKSELTVNCVRSVLRHTSLEAIEIMVVDNGSSPEHITNLQIEFGSQITLLEVGVNRYFGEGNNIGVDFARGEFVVFMNNDIVVTHNWLDKLSAHLTDDADVVGPAFLYPDGRVQECGAYIGARGQSIQQFKGGAVKDMPQKPFECDYISAATILLKKNTFLKVGGFDLCYEPAYYEDVDLCLKIASYGGKIICVPEVKIFHNENATSSDVTLGLRLSDDIVAINKSKFLDRWAPFLADRIGNPIEKQKVMGAAQAPLRLCKPEMLPKKVKRALLFSPYPLTPGGGEKYLLTIAQELSTRYQTTLAFEYRYSVSRMRQLESYLNLNLANVTLMDFFIAKDQEWDVSFVLGNSIAPPFPKLSPISFYICQFPFDRNSYLGKPIPHSDEYHYLCYSDFVKSHILSSKYIQHTNVSVLSPVIQTYPAATAKEKIILSVGRFFAGGHCKNQLLLIEAFKKLTAHPSFAGWKLVLIGSTRPEHVHRTYYTQCIQASRGFNIEITPDVSFDVLSAMYAKASLYWHGSGLGVNSTVNPEQLEHFGITPLEAASAGCHVFVPDAGGPKEIAKKAPGKFYVYSSIEELVGTAIKVCTNGLVTDDKMQHQMERFIDTFNVEMFSKNLTNAISHETSKNTCDYTTVIRPDDHRVRWVGWSYLEHDYKWSNMHESKIQFLWEDVTDQQTLLTLQFNTFGAQKIRIKLNGCLVLEETVAGDPQRITFEASGLVFGFNSLVFSFPNAHQPSSDDPRILAIAFRSLIFNRSEQTQNIQAHTQPEAVLVVDENEGLNIPLKVQKDD